MYIMIYIINISLIYPSIYNSHSSNRRYGEEIMGNNSSNPRQLSQIAKIFLQHDLNYSYSTHLQHFRSLTTQPRPLFLILFPLFP